MEGSPAERAGLEVGDIITAYGGKAVDGRETLFRLIVRTSPGTEVEITFVRAGIQKSVVVAIGTRPRDVRGHTSD